MPLRLKLTIWSEWIHNSHVATASDPTNAGVPNRNAVTVTTAAHVSVNREAPTTTAPPSIPVRTSVPPLGATTTKNLPLAMGQGSLIQLPNTGPVQIPQSTTTSQVPSVPQISTVNVPASLLSNLSPGPVSASPVNTNHTVVATVFPATSVAPTASPIIPVTAGGTVNYVNPSSFATVPAPGSSSVPTTIPGIPSTATPFAPLRSSLHRNH